MSGDDDNFKEVNKEEFENMMEELAGGEFMSIEYSDQEKIMAHIQAISNIVEARVAELDDDNFDEIILLAHWTGNQLISLAEVCHITSNIGMDEDS